VNDDGVDLGGGGYGEGVAFSGVAGRRAYRRPRCHRRRGRPAQPPRARNEVTVTEYPPVPDRRSRTPRPAVGDVAVLGDRWVARTAPLQASPRAPRRWGLTRRSALAPARRGRPTGGRDVHLGLPAARTVPSWVIRRIVTRPAKGPSLSFTATSTGPIGVGTARTTRVLRTPSPSTTNQARQGIQHRPHETHSRSHL
jgi:hypothetical protein